MDLRQIFQSFSIDFLYFGQSVNRMKRNSLWENRMNKEQESKLDKKKEDELIRSVLLQLARILREENLIDEKEEQKMKLLICSGNERFISSGNTLAAKRNWNELKKQVE